MKTLPATLYVIKGEPIALARARFSAANKRVYDSQKTLKLIAGIGLRSQHDDQPMYTGPLHLNVTFFMGIPPTSKRTTMHHCYKPDLDNLIKFLCDISNSILFEDDALVSKVTAIKIYDEHPRTEFTIRSLE